MQIRHEAEWDSCSASFSCFDTWNQITLFGCEEAESMLASLYDLCLGYERLFSFTDPCSDIARVNGPACRTVVSPATASLLGAMKRFAREEPAFDFTIGAVSFWWKRAQRLPAAVELASMLEHVGAGKVHIDGCTVVKDDPLVKVDVGGAAKGFIADELARNMRTHEVGSATVDLGGNLFLVGRHPSGRRWHVEVDLPAGLLDHPVRFELADASAVTSGSYERGVTIEGRRYQHIIDPRTGWPSQSDVVSATAVCGESLLADMLATTAVLVGSSGLDELVARHPDVNLAVVTDCGTLMRSGGTSPGETIVWQR